MEHIEDHLALKSFDKAVECPHLQCRSVHQDREALKNHFETFYYISAPYNNGTTMSKRKAQETVSCGAAKRKRVPSNSDEETENVFAYIDFGEGNI